MGLNEVMIGLGFTLGPPIGSILLTLGGFHFPFLVGGICVIITIPISMMIGRLEKSKMMIGTSGDSAEKPKISGGDSPESQPTRDLENPMVQESSSPESYGSLLRRIPFVVPSGFLFLGTTIFGITEPIYTLHCEEYLGFDQLQTGYMLGLLSVVYSVLGAPVGHYADKNKNHGTVIFYGALVSGFSLLGLGMRPVWLSHQLKFWTEIILLCCLGMGQAGILIPTLPAMRSGTKVQPQSQEDFERKKDSTVETDLLSEKERENLSEKDANKSSTDSSSSSTPSSSTPSSSNEIIVTLFNMFQQGGLIFGPILGAVLNEMYGFPFTMVVGAAITLGYCVVASLAVRTRF